LRGRSWIGKNYGLRREWIRHRFAFLAEYMAIADLKQASEVSSVAAADRACEHRPKAGWLQPVALEPNRKAIREKPTKRRSSNKGFLSMAVAEYLQLLDWTGGQNRRDGKLGTIPTDLKPLLDRMGMSAEMCVDCVRRFGKWHASGVGRLSSLKPIAWIQGVFLKRNSPGVSVFPSKTGVPKVLATSATAYVHEICH